MNSTFANVLIISALISFSLAAIAWYRKDSPGAKSLAVVMVSVGLWSFMYALRWTTDQPQSIYFWLNLTFTGVVVAPSAMLVFALQFADPSWNLTLRRLALFAVEPVITLCVIWSDPLHHLFFGTIRDTNSVFSGSFWFWLNTIYSFMLMLLAVIVLHRHTHHVPDITRHQSRIIIAGYLIPILTCFIEILKLSPFQKVDITPFTFLSSGFLVIYGFFFYRLLDITPVAYSKLAKTTSDALVILDRHQRIVDLNPAAREFFHASSELIGEDAVKVFAAWPEVLLALEKNAETTLILQKTQNCSKVLEVQIILLEDSNKGYEGVFLTIHDITRFKDTEAALLASEEKIRSLFLSITDTIFILDKDGMYIDIALTNPQHLEKLNRDPFHIIGKTVNDVFPTDTADIITDAIHKSLESGGLLQVDYPMLVDGKELWFSGNVSPLTVDTVIWVARDITERKQMEQSLRESGARLAMAQNISHLGSWEYDLGTDEFWASDEYYRIMGISLENPINSIEVLGDYFIFKDNSNWASNLKTWLHNLTPLDRDIEIVRKGETESRVLHIIASLIYDANGKPYKASGVVQDITTQKQVEKALEKRILALTRPLDTMGDIEIEELFNLNELQRLQDDFASATGVASIIARKDGTAITQNSNFCRLCGEIIRKNEVAGKECIQNDAEVCAAITDHSVILPCKSIGLMHAGAPILVGGQNIATWIIGQIRTEDSSEETMLGYIHRFGFNEEEALAAYREIPFMSRDKFASVAQSLFTFSTQLSNAAFQNIQQARFISERREAEEALRISENKLRSLFKAMTDVIIIYDSDGYYREIAQTDSRQYFRPPAEMINRCITDILPAEIASQIMKTIHQTLSSKEMSRVDYSLEIDGKEFWFTANVSPLTENSVIWVARDITERKQLEQTLRESGTRLEMAQNIARVGNWEYNLATEEFWASAEFYRIMGMDADKQIKSLDELEKFLPKIEYSNNGGPYKKGQKQFPPLDQNIEVTRPGETEPRILHSVASIMNDADGKPYKASGVVQDITSQKQVEKALSKRMLALTQPLDKPGNMDFEDLFNLEDIQKLQDDFASATGVASLITRIDGTPITRPSRFGRLCGEMIRMTERGMEDCHQVDAGLSHFTGNHPVHFPCKNIGCFHAGAPIMVGGQHIATWVIGQVKMEDTPEATAVEYFRKLGLNEEQALAAYREIPYMPQEQFNSVTQALFTLTTQLSDIAYQNVQQARFITERKQAEEALQQSENKLRSIFTAMTDVIMIFDRDGIFREVPTTGTIKYTDSPYTLVNKSIHDVFPPEIAALFQKTIQQTLELKDMMKVDYCLPIGSFNNWFSANVSPLTEDSVVWVARDITERKNAEDSLHFQNMHDNLTGLYNRQYYETEVERLQRSRLFPISILVMDVDGLKWVNDHRGHSMGDELLRRVAGVLKSAFRPEDMVARMGGDEFVIVLPQTDEMAAQQAMQRMESILEKHNQLFPPDQRLGLSMGVATGGQGILLTEIFKLADQAMYIMKNKKKELAAIEGRHR